MRVSFDWIKEFVGVDAPVATVAERLTMIGFEVEAIEMIGGDAVLEINVTPNRPDCLSIIGIAREVAAAFRLPLRLPDLNFTSESKELDFNIDILDPALCNRYAGRIVHSVKVGPSPDWMKQRLEKCGIRAINNIVDVTNYVLLEFGHPLHAFDLRTLKGHQIRVGTPKAVEGLDSMPFTTLDGAERTIPGSSLLIWDGERPVAIAGVMGGANTEVTDSTTDIFIESAYFEPTSIRRTSKALGLKTESSYRFERGTDIKVLKKALDRAAMLMRDLAGGVIAGKLDIYPKRYHPHEITVRYDRVNALIGLDIAKADIRDNLEALGMEVVEAGQASFMVKTPPYRLDLQREADIVEEVVRMYGYDRVPSTLPKAILGGLGDGGRIASRKLAGDILQSFLKAGFTEAINYSFMGSRELDLLAISGADFRRRLIAIKNPLREEEAFMRTTLIPSLVRNMVHNVSHGNRELKLFEMGRVFIGTGEDSLPQEREHVAAVVYREKSKSLYKEETADFMAMKGLVEAILSRLGAGDVSYIRSSEPFLHPGRSADLMVGTEKAGYFGVLSPAVIEELQIKAQKPSLLVLEFDLRILMAAARREVTYRQLPRYPYVERDTAIVVDSAIDAASILCFVRAYDSGLIEDVSIFDVYQGESIGEGRKSVAFNVRYRAVDRTLTDEEVEALHKALVGYISEKTGGIVRS